MTCRKSRFGFWSWRIFLTIRARSSGSQIKARPLPLERPDAKLTAEEIELHESLFALKDLRAKQPCEGVSSRDTVDPVLRGCDPAQLSAMVRKLRSAVTAKLYPGAEPGSEEMQLLIGPLD
jgi:hypothetical protein